jgi:hypothetical protein
MHPDTSGYVTVHGETEGDVWCPWCGDAMERAEDVLTERELTMLRNGVVPTREDRLA